MTQEQAAKLATLAHNRTFTPRDAAEYGFDLKAAMRAGYVENVGQTKHYPTAAGWAEIDRLCART